MSHGTMLRSGTTTQHGANGDGLCTRNGGKKKKTKTAGNAGTNSTSINAHKHVSRYREDVRKIVTDKTDVGTKIEQYDENL